MIEEEKMMENCLEVGTYCLKKLSKMRDEYEIIGDVRGKGLLIGIELVADKKVSSRLTFLNSLLIYILSHIQHQEIACRYNDVTPLSLSENLTREPLLHNGSEMCFSIIFVRFAIPQFFFLFYL